MIEAALSLLLVSDQPSIRDEVIPVKLPVIDPRSVRVAPGALQLEMQRSVVFNDPAMNRAANFLRVPLMVSVAQQGPNTLAYLGNVVGRDDRGNLFMLSGYHLGGGEVSLSGSLSDARCKRVQWLEGDISAWSRIERIHCEIPVPALDQAKKHPVGEVEIRVESYDGAILQDGAPPRKAGLRVRATVQAPQLTDLTASDDEHEFAPVLIGKSGQRYTCETNHAHLESGGRGVVAGVDALYVAPPEPVVALRFSFEYRSRPQFLASFRLENLPLPVDPPLTSAGQPRELSDPTRFAFYREKGAVLVSPVRLGDQPAPAGLLLLGLQRLGLSSPETVRWIELPIENGEARFPGLAPGKYRVLRRYKPFGNLSNAPGRWVDAELKITVPGSGTAPLPPLRLVKQP